MTTPPTTEQDIQILHVDPKTLGVLDQARADATPDDELIASVKQHGIMQPPTIAYDDEQGSYVIVMGHRRVGAAIAAGLVKIPVLLRPGVDQEALKLEQQIVENERRKALTAAELAQGYKKLELFGKTPADIAAELGEKPERVRAGLKINASKAAAQLLDEEPSIDFEQAAIIAEFDDHPKLQRKLIETATTNPANFQRDVENQRTQREVDTRISKLKAQLDADDVALADVVNYSVEGWWSGKGMSSAGVGRSLDRLGIRVEEHTECPGHAAVIHKAQSYYLKDQPESWLMYVCTDWKANGHNGDAPAAAVEKSPEQLEREAEWERERAARAARQELIDANTRARRTWLHGHLTTGRLRPTAQHFDVMAAALALQLESNEPAPAHVTLELLTGKPVTRRPYYQDDSNVSELAAAIHSGLAPSLRAIVANAIATFEDAIEDPAAIAYFDALAAWGYTLTDTDREHIAAATANRDEAAIDEDGGVADYSDYDTDDEDD